MVARTFNMQGYAFQEGIRVLIAAHETTAEALYEELQRAKENALAIRRRSSEASGSGSATGTRMGT